MKIEIELGTLKQFLGYVGALVNECKIVVDKKGWMVKIVDPAHVAMLKLHFKKKGFKKYNYRGKGVEIGIPITKLVEFTTLSKKKTDIVGLDIDVETNRLIASLNGMSRTITLVDTKGMSDPKLPNLDLPAEVNINLADFLTAIKGSRAVLKGCGASDDFITIAVDKKSFNVNAENGIENFDYRAEKKDLVKLNCKEPIKSMYASDYLNIIVKPTTSKEVNLNIGEDYPIKITGETEYFDYLWLLAPRIDSE